MQLTIKETNSEGEISVPGFDHKYITGYGCNQKPTDTGTILNYRSFAPIQYKRSVIQLTVHRAFSTSSWEHSDKSMETNREQWLTNQYPENWSAKVTAEAMCKTFEGNRKPLDNERSSSTESPKDVKPLMLMVQYRGNQTQ